MKQTKFSSYISNFLLFEVNGPESESKEFKSRLKYGLFHIKFYSIFQDWNRLLADLSRVSNSLNSDTGSLTTLRTYYIYTSFSFRIQNRCRMYNDVEQNHFKLPRAFESRLYQVCQGFISLTETLSPLYFECVKT